MFLLIRNAQNDIIGLIDRTGAMVVQYAYDTWGKQLSVTGTLASTVGTINPFRYRGYVYDDESGLYYLQSRYYNPEWCRFINADGYASTGQGLFGTNVFSYCENNPVNRADPSGMFWQELWNAFKECFQQARSVFAVAGVITQLDSPVPGPADVLGAILAGGAIVACGVAAINKAAKSAPSISIPKSKSKEKDQTTTPPKTITIIYRYGGTNPGNLTPRESDVTGLSFSTIPKPGAAMTTIEALNATGVVRAVRDGATHVSVKPVGATVQEWIDAGRESPWTAAVKSAVAKWDGGN